MENYVLIPLLPQKKDAMKQKIGILFLIKRIT